MKKYSEYQTKEEILKDIDFAFEIVKEYLIKVDAPVSKLRAALEVQKYLEVQRKNPFGDQEAFKRNIKSNLDEDEEKELVKQK